jgi:hypothetical protein
VIGKGRVEKNRGKRNDRTPWKTIHGEIDEKALTQESQLGTRQEPDLDTGSRLEA